MTSKRRRLRDHEILLDVTALCRALDLIEADEKRRSKLKEANISPRTVDRLKQAARSGQVSYIVAKATAEVFARVAGVTLEELCLPPSAQAVRSSTISANGRPVDLPLRFGEVSQAAAVSCTTWPAAEYARFLWGDATDRGHPPTLRWQHEYMQFAAGLQAAIDPLRRLKNWFRPYSQYSRSDERRFPRSVVLKARLRVSNPHPEMGAFEIRQQPPRPFPSGPSNLGFLLRYEVVACGRIEIRPRESQYVDLVVRLEYELAEKQFDHPHHEAAAHLRASEALRVALTSAADAARAILVDLNVLFDDGVKRQVSLKLQVPELPEELRHWDCDVREVSDAVSKIDKAAAESYHQHTKEELARLAREHEQLRKNPPS